MITLKRFNGALVTPKDDAVLFDHLVDDSGIFEGISVSHLGANQLLVAAGRGIIKGRDFTVEEETILAQLSPSGAQKGRLLIRVDISNTEAPITLVTQVATTLPTLVQEDINRDGTIYELSIVEYDVSELLISNLVFVGKMLQPLKSKLTDHVNNGNIHLTPSEKTKALGGSNAWVATEVVAQNNAVSLLTIPNFVFTENCTVTFRAQVDVPKDEWSCIVINGNNDFVYALRTPSKGVIPAGSWLTGTNVTVTLSTVKIPIGDPQTARMGTAFYSGQQTPTNWVATNAVASDNNTAVTLTIPNYVFTEGCRVTFRSPIDSPISPYLRVVLHDGVGFALRTSSAPYAAAPECILRGGCYVTVTLSEAFTVSVDGSPWPVAFVDSSPSLYVLPAGSTNFSGYPGNSFIFIKR